ncbi:MAG: hypothetical protein ACREEM_03045 [Blastocatellia bacterium]
MKENDDLVSHCKCDLAYIASPAQMDCPWCGCGWLFNCLNCRKAFTFARGVEIKDSWFDLARRDLSNFGFESLDDDDIEEWIQEMKELLAGVKVGKRYVCLDGLIIPADAASIDFEGWHSKHKLDFVPQLAAIQDPTIIASILTRANYWKSTALPDREAEQAI